jgi:hypothetical protein
MKRWPKFEYVVPQRLKIKQTILEIKLRFQLLADLKEAVMRLAKLSKKLMMISSNNCSATKNFLPIILEISKLDNSWQNLQKRAKALVSTVIAKSMTLNPQRGLSTGFTRHGA